MSGPQLVRQRIPGWGQFTNMGTLYDELPDIISIIVVENRLSLLPGSVNMANLRDHLSNIIRKLAFEGCAQVRLNPDYLHVSTVTCQNL